MIRVGSARVEITPPVGLPLSGFAMRQNRPSVAVDDPLFVKALALEADGELLLLLSYDLLGFDLALDGQIRAWLNRAFGSRLSPARVLITTTHTRSGPPTMPIAGETRVPDTYIQMLSQASQAVAEQAFGRLTEASLVHAATHLKGINLNRRRAQFPAQSGEHFPLDDALDLFVFRGPEGACLGSLARFSCHAVTMTTQHVSADFPGALTRRLEAQLGASQSASCLFLPGTAGDANPATVSQDHAAMLAFVEAMAAQLSGLTDRLQPVQMDDVRLLTRSFRLPFAPFPPEEQLLAAIARNERILAGDLSSPDVQPMLQEYAAWRYPDDSDREGTVRHWAQVYKERDLHTLKAIAAAEANPGAPFQAAALKLGPFVFLGLSGEIFTTLGQRLQTLAVGQQVLVISYLSPIVGYIPTAPDCAIGGYEIGNAWMWYRMPGPFRDDIAALIEEQVQGLLADLRGGR